MDDQKTTTSTTSSNSKRAKFTKVANGRVTKAIAAIRVVANMSKMELSKDVFAQEDADAIIEAMEVEVSRMAKRLHGAVTGHQLDVEFDLERGKA